jgi:hypothetical protein
MRHPLPALRGFGSKEILRASGMSESMIVGIVDAKALDGALDLSVTKKQLYGSQIAGPR